LYRAILVQNSGNKLKNNPKDYINVGCGPNLHPNFINIDFQWRPNMDLCRDITKGIPLENNFAKGFFSEYCLEHITFHQCFNVLKEFHRILRTGSVARIVVPDAELYLDLYQKDKQGKVAKFSYVSEQDIQDNFTSIMSVNRVFRSHGHLLLIMQEH
jgi:predicted SAM-dependent methyltransferase